MDRVALTLPQIESYDDTAPLPKSAEKEGKAAAKFLQDSGRDPVEIDALVALHPRDLHQIVANAVAPYADLTLQQRTIDAVEAWEAQVQSTDRYAELHEKIDACLSRMQEASDELERVQAEVTGQIEETMPFEAPEPDITDHAEPRFDTKDDYITSTRKQQQYRDFIGLGEDEDES